MQKSAGPTVDQPIRYGPYRVLNMIGKGGMAKVYRCIHEGKQSVAAVKIMLQTHRTDEGMLRRFEREIETMKNVTHPYIVPLLDYSLSVDQSYLVMPYFDGGSVADRLNAQLYSPQETAMLLTHLAFALDYAHSQGYIHRDLKPSNILLDDQGQAYLSDFGLAKSIDGAGGTALSGTGQLFGTFAYMSPELADGAPADVRSDVYALGIVVCELLTGHRPFQTDQAVGYAYLHRRMLPPAPSQLNPGVPAALDSVILLALEKNPIKRPQSAGELARAFSKAVASLPPELQTRRAVPMPRPNLQLVQIPGNGSAGTAASSSNPRRPAAAPPPEIKPPRDLMTTILISLVMFAIVIFAILGAVMLLRR